MIRRLWEISSRPTMSGPIRAATSTWVKWSCPPAAIAAWCRRPAMRSRSSCTVAPNARCDQAASSFARIDTRVFPDRQGVVVLNVDEIAGDHVELAPAEDVAGHAGDVVATDRFQRIAAREFARFRLLQVDDGIQFLL